MLELHIGNVLTKIIGDIPAHVKSMIREQCAYSIKGAEFSTYGAATYCPICKKNTEQLTWEEKRSCPQDGFMYRKCHMHGLVKPVSLWDGRKFLFDARSENFPTGVISRVTSVLKTFGVPYKIIDERIVPYTRRLTWHGPQLRYYQKDAVNSLITKSRGILQGATAMGKSTVLAALTAEVGVNTLILAHTAAVFNQLYETIKKDLKMPIGRIGDGYDEPGKITVAMPQSLVGSIKVPKRKLVKGVWKTVNSSVAVIKDKYKDFLVNTEALYIDECFPGKTKVHTDRGVYSIYEIVKNKLPYNVLSFNGKTFEYKRIIRYLQNKSPNKFVKITLANNRLNTITATYNHNIYLYDYDSDCIKKKQAECICVGDYLLARPRLDGKNFNIAPVPTKQQQSILLGLSIGDGCVDKTSGGYRMRLIQGDDQIGYLYWKLDLLSNLFHAKPYKGISGYTGKKTINYVSSRVTPVIKNLYNIRDINNFTKEIQKLDSLALAVLFMDDGSQVAGCARISTHSLSLECNKVLCSVLSNKFGICASIRKDNRINKYYIELNTENSKRLFSLICTYIPDCMGYKLPVQFRNKYTLKKQQFNEFGVSVVTNVSATTGPKKFVYNLEVEDNHNYVVCNNILVSNCHRVACDTVQLVANSCVNAYFRIGVSATPYRADLLDILIEAATGKVNFKYTATQAISDGYLSKPNIHLVRFPQKPYPRKKLSLVKDSRTGQMVEKEVPVKYADLYKDRVTNNKQRNLLIANIAYKHYKKNESVLVIVRHLEHGENLYNELKYLGPTVKWVNGENNTEELKQVLKELNDGTCKICIASGIFNEGIDVTGLNVCINTTACDSPVTAMQILGRTLRRTSTKSEVDFYDIFDYGVRWLGEHANSRLDMYKTEPGFDIFNEEYTQYI